MSRPAQQTTPIENLWTVKDVMAFLTVKRTWVYDQVHNGSLPHCWLGSRLRFEPEQIREYVKRQRNTTPNATVLPIAGGRR
jgi:excisionase family DNA binding protein